MTETTDQASPGAKLFVFRWSGIGAMALIALGGAWYDIPAITFLGSLIAGTGLVTRGWAAAALWGLADDRRISGNRAFPGDTLTLEIGLENRKPLPLSWVRARQWLSRGLTVLGPNSDRDPENPMQDPMPDSDPAVDTATDSKRQCLVVETSLGWYRSATLTREVRCDRRGWHGIDPLQVASSDVFGLFIRSRESKDRRTIIVYPRLFTMTELGLPARHPLGRSRDPRRLFEDPNRPMGLRDYGPETPFKAIDWKATARTGEMQARIYEPTVTLESVIFLAVDGFTGDENADAFEAAVSAAASIAHQQLTDRHAVGVFVNALGTDNGGPVMLPPGRQSGRDTLILESLARIENRTSTPFDAFLENNLARLGAGTTLAVIAKDCPPSTLARLDAIHRRGRPVVLLTFDDTLTTYPTLPHRQLSLPSTSGIAA